MQAAAFSGLYSHIPQSDGHDANEIPKPFKSTKGRDGKKSGKGKQKQQQHLQQQQPPPHLQEEEIKQYDETGNYHHNDNYQGHNRGSRPYRGQGGSRRNNSRGRGQQGSYHGQFQNNRGQYNNPHRGYYNNNYGNYRGRGGHSHGSNNYRGCGCGRGNYQGNDNYHYQYYAHDDGYQVEQYGPPCALCSGFNLSPKHCFKGEHDINNLMEKMSLGSSNQHQSGLYQ